MDQEYKKAHLFDASFGTDFSDNIYNEFWLQINSQNYLNTL